MRLQLQGAKFVSGVSFSVARLSGRSRDRFDLAARVDFRRPDGALYLRDRCYQVDPLSVKYHGVKQRR